MEQLDEKTNVCGRHVPWAETQNQAKDDHAEKNVASGLDEEPSKAPMLTNNDFWYPRPSVANETHSNTSSSCTTFNLQKLDKQVYDTYCESEIRNPIQHSSAYDHNACKKWEVEIDPDHVQALLGKRGKELALCISGRVCSFKLPLRHWWYHKFQWRMRLYTSLPEREKPRKGYQLPLHNVVLSVFFKYRNSKEELTQVIYSCILERIVLDKIN